MSKGRSILLFICLVLNASALAQYEKKSLNAIRVESAPHLDGILDDDVWKNAPAAEGFVVLDPIPGAPLPQNTEVKVIYTDQAIYIGFLNFDTEPDNILQQLSGRDNLGNSDYCGITFSCYRDGINGFGFITTPKGEQTDMRIDAVNGQDNSWNAIWNCKAKVLDNGWSAELMIPFAALRFPSSDEQVWNINFVRHLRRVRHTAYWNGIDPLVPGTLTQMGTLTGIKGVSPPKRIFLFPYASGYYDLIPSEKGKIEKSTSYNTGMDLKLGLSDAFTLDATLIPDYGQVISDQRILNVSPFEVQFQDNRQFFMEGTELFNKAGLFYSRRVGWTPEGYNRVSGQLKPGEIVVNNPGRTQLYNATKISGRTPGGTGLGFFNAVSAPTYSTLQDSTGKQREYMTSPLKNYNIVVFDQNLKYNSFVTLINTNVMREGGLTDASVIGSQFDFRNKKNSYSIKGNGAWNYKVGTSYRKGNPSRQGFGSDVSINKISGNYTFGAGIASMSNAYDPNDLGFNTINNFITTYWNNAYNIYKPFWKLNSLWSSLKLSYSKLYLPREYIGLSLSGNVGVTTKKFNTANLMWSANPTNYYDYFEARMPGKKFLVYPNVMVGGWISTDYRKPIALDIGAWYTSWQNTGRYQFNWRVAPRFRLNDHWLITYVYSKQGHYNDRGYSTKDASGNPVFGRRNVVSHTNVLTINCAATPWMNAICRIRHYWGYSYYHAFYSLDSSGELIPGSFNGFADSNEGTGQSLVNRSYNSFTIDLIYKWIFIPGSEVSVVWKNAIDNEINRVAASLPEDIRYVQGLAPTNSFSIKLLHFIDLNKTIKLLERKHLARDK
jgi:hypothetical protein